MDASVINRIRDETGLNYAKIAKRLDVNRENISAIITGKVGMSADLMRKILIKFPDISPRWLLTGEGPMLLKESAKSLPKPGRGELRYYSMSPSKLGYTPGDPVPANANVLLLESEASAGMSQIQLLQEVDKKKFQPNCYIPGLEGTGYVGIKIVGESMVPTILNGDLLIVRRVEGGISFHIADGLVHLAILNDDEMICKRVYRMYRAKDPAKDTWQLVSDNPLHKPRQIDASEVRNLFVAEGLITLHLESRQYHLPPPPPETETLKKEVAELKAKLQHLEGKG